MNVQSPQPPGTLRATDLHRRLTLGEPLQLVDVREAAELELARLAVPVLHLPLSRSSEWVERIGVLLDRERDVVVLCHAGIRSWQFACWLIETQGFERVWNLHGGIEAWSVEVDPAVPRY
ncbi:sulfurtransferase [Synechococcus sp. Tobar12-5m-g]|jgi:rhodanese-related sulfurtransferase|uniref:rhodanese-like domain-containing protein n=1 Tax=unclassified Synechococcus TaxID=2626047 RepID=UPI0020CC6C51|nr:MULTISPECIES: rhodanese-like domain-containing protein [unclassified Synechococcus]MCP9772563.1 sulfurtransferase [Synechococcus sp. Tobar12-5m-g]MCP9873402.1 sulfurtransferase [Synechococcus sp. Cruz CV-v-12]